MTAAGVSFSLLPPMTPPTWLKFWIPVWGTTRGDLCLFPVGEADCALVGARGRGRFPGNELLAQGPPQGNPYLLLGGAPVYVLWFSRQDGISRPG